MDQGYGLTFMTLLLSVLKVYGQACPEGTNVAQMCMPGTYSGERVLIDTASYDPAISNCSCTFGTTSSVMKVVTYVAPNYPECNSAVRLYSSSGNSIRFQCLMSGTYLDTSEHNVGVTTFERYGDLYDKNYCLMLEIAGRVGDTVTVTCTGDLQNVQDTSASNVAQNTTDIGNNTVNDINNTTEGSMNMSAETSSSVINSSTTDTLTTTPGRLGEPTGIEESTTGTLTTVSGKNGEPTGMELSTTGTLSTASGKQGEATGMEVSTTGTLSTVSGKQGETTGMELSTTGTLSTASGKQGETTGMEVSTTGTLSTVSGKQGETTGMEVSTMGASATETVKPVNTSSFKVSTDGTLLTTAENLGASANMAVSTTSAARESTTLYTSQAQHRESGTTTGIPQKPEVTNFSSEINSMNDIISTTVIATSNVINSDANDTVESSLATDATFKPRETNHADTVTAIVTGTVLFNGGGTNSSKTIQTIGAVPSHVLLGQDQGQRNSFETTTFQTNTITSDTSVSSSNARNPISMATVSNLLSADTYGTTQPADISNLLFMEPSSSLTKVEFKGTERRNISDTGNSDYSLQFPSFDSMVPIPTNNNATDTVNRNITVEYDNIINGTLNLTSSYETSIFTNSSGTDAKDISDNNTLFHEIQESNRFSIKMTSPDIQRARTGDEVSSNDINVNAQKTSPFMTSEVRFVMDNTEPTDAVGNITIRSVTQAENTTDIVTHNLTINSVTDMLGESSNLSKAMEHSDFTSISTGLPVLTTKASPAFNPQVSDSLLKDIAQTSAPALFEQSTPVNSRKAEFFTNAPSMFESTERTNVSGGLKKSERPEFDKMNSVFIVDPIVGNEISTTNVPTTPSPLDYIYKDPTMQPTHARNTAVHSKVSFSVPAVSPESTSISDALDTAMDAGTDKYNSFKTSTYYFPGQQTTDPAVGDPNYGSLNVIGTITKETSTEKLPELHENVQSVSAVDKENISFSNVSTPEVISPAMNETNINYLSSVQRIPLSEVNSVESIPDTSTGNLDPLSFLHQDGISINITESTLDAFDQTPFVKQENTHLSEVTTSMATPTPDVTQVDHLSFIHRESVPLPQVSVAETSQEITTPNVDHLSFVHRESVPLSEVNVTGISPEITTPNVDHLSFVHRESIMLSNVKATEIPPEITTQNVDHLSFVHRESVPLSEVNITEISPEITTPNVDHLSFIHRESVPLSEDNVNEISPEITTPNVDHLSFVHRESVPLSDIKVTEFSPEITTPNVDHLSFVHRESVLLSDVNATEVSPDITTPTVDHLSFVHRESVPFSDIKVTDVSPEITTPTVDHLSFVHRESVPFSDIKVTDVSPEITTPNVDHLSFVHRESVPLSDDNVTEVSPEITTPNVDHLSFVHHESVPLSEVNITEVSPDITTPNIDHLSFVHLESVPLSDVNVTEVSPEITTPNVDHLSFVHRESVLLSDVNATEVSPDITTPNADHLSFVHRESVLLSDVNVTEVSPEITTPNVDHLSFVHREMVPLSDSGVTETLPERMPFTEQITSLPSVNAVEKISETGLGTAFTEQPSVTRQTTNGYVINAGIDQHNLLALDIHHETTDKDLLVQTTQDLPAATYSSGTEAYTDQVVTKDIMHSTTEASPTSTVSTIDSVPSDITTNTIPQTQAVTTTEVVPDIVEEVMVQEKMPHEKVMLLKNVPQDATQPGANGLIKSAADTYLQSDILGDIEKQIITEEKFSVTQMEAESTISQKDIVQSTSPATKIVSIGKENSAKEAPTLSPEFTEVITGKLDTVKRNENTPPEIFHPEPIIPKGPSHIDNHMSIPTTPVQRFNIIEETVVDPDEVNPDVGTEKETTGDSDMNVYFDTGRSKNSPNEMNNDTYIIVVGAIVGLVVLAVVVGILCHNSRKTRSEKVNISGAGDPSNHQNQAFDSQAADAEQGTTSVVVNGQNGVDQGSGLPEENGGSTATFEQEENGNV